MKRLFQVVALMAVALGASAESFRPTISVTLASSTAGTDIVIGLRGEWPDSCTPRMLDTARDGDGIIVRMEYDTRGCAKRTSQYRLSTRFSAGPDLDTGVYPVRVYARGEGDALFRLVAFDLVELGRTGQFRPEGGIWWPSGEGAGGAGLGFSLEFQGSRTVMLANLYDEFGDPVWMIGSGMVNGRVLRSDLLKFTGGQPMFGSYTPPEEAIVEARVYVQFHSRASATLWLTAPMDGSARSQLLLQPMEISRYAFGYGAGPFAATGHWLLLRNKVVFELDLYPDLLKRRGNRGLTDRRRDWRLECDDSAGLPSRCELFDADHALLGTFDDVGLDRMRGSDVDGNPMQAIRLE